MDTAFALIRYNKLYLKGYPFGHELASPGFDIEKNGVYISTSYKLDQITYNAPMIGIHCFRQVPVISSNVVTNNSCDRYFCSAVTDHFNKIGQKLIKVSCRTTNKNDITRIFDIFGKEIYQFESESSSETKIFVDELTTIDNADKPVIFLTPSETVVVSVVKINDKTYGRDFFHYTACGELLEMQFLAFNKDVDMDTKDFYIHIDENNKLYVATN